MQTTAAGRAVLLGIALTTLASPPVLQADDWDIECVDCPKVFTNLTDRSLGVDLQGNRHIVYGGDHLYHAWNDGSTWRYEVVDSSRHVGAGAALAFDACGNAHVVYEDQASGYVKYGVRHGVRTSQVWALQRVATGSYPAVTVDGYGRPHLVFGVRLGSDYALAYAVKDGAGWSMEVVEGMGYYACVAADQFGHPHVTDGYQYGFKDGTGWHIQDIPWGTTSSYQSVGSLWLDSSGIPHMTVGFGLYYDPMTLVWLGYARLEANQWTTETLRSAGGWLAPGYSSSLVVDPAGSPQVAFAQCSYGYGYMYYDVEGWHTELVDPGYAQGGVSLGADGSSIAYHAGYELRLANRSDQGWGSELVDQAGCVGEDAASALDSQDRLHVSYRDEVSGNLRYAVLDGETWSLNVIDSSAQGTGICVDADDAPHVVYFHDSTDCYRHAMRVADQWIIEDMPVEAGTSWGSFAVDQDGYLHTCNLFWHSPVYWLSHHWEDGQGWHSEVVDTDARSSGTLRLFDGRLPRICYAGYTPSQCLRFAWKDAGGWHIETVSSGQGAGEYSSMVLDAFGRPHIAFRNPGDYRLWYAHRPGSQWILESTGDNGVNVFSSISLDCQDSPRISFRNGWALEIAIREHGAWRVRTVDAPGLSVGSYNTLQLDGSGRAHIVYCEMMDPYQYGHLLHAQSSAAVSLCLSASQSGSELVLSWSPVLGADTYRVYGEPNHPWFSPDLTPPSLNELAVLPSGATTWSSPSGIGDPSANWTYRLIAFGAGDQELFRSAPAGEFDQELSIGVGQEMQSSAR